MEREELIKHKEKIDAYIQDKAGLSLEEGFFVLTGLAKDYEQTIFGVEEDVVEEELDNEFDFVEDETADEEDDEALQEAEPDFDDEEEPAPVPTVVRQPTQTQSNPRPQTASPQVKQVKKVNIISLLKKPIVKNKSTGRPKAPPRVDG